MTHTFRTLMMTVAVVGLTAGTALAEGTHSSSSMDTSATMQTPSATEAPADAQAGVQASATSTSNASQVENVQAMLTQEGYPVSVDGVWGTKSASALRQFQQANNLDASGKINAETLAALNIDANAATGVAAQ